MLKDIFYLDNYYFNPYALPYSLMGILTICEGVFIYMQNRKSSINFAYTLCCICATFWQMSLSAMYSSKTEPIALFWGRYLSFLGIIFIGPAVYFFSISWQGTLQKKRKSLYFNFVLASILYLYCISSTSFIRGLWQYPWGFYPKAGTTYFILIIWFYILMVASIWNFVDVYRKESAPIKKKQAKLIIAAFSIAFIGSIEFLPNYGFPFYLFAFIPLFTCITIVGYSIIRYKLLDIETVIHKTIAWLIANFALLMPFLLLGYFIKSWYAGLNFISAISFLAALSLTYLFFIKLFQPKIDHFFQRRKYDLEEISYNFAEDLIHLKGLNQLTERIENTIANTLYPQQIDVFIYNETEKTYRLAVSKSKTQKTAELKGDDPFLQWLIKSDKIVYREFIDIDPDFSNIKKDARNYFDETSAFVVLPMVVGERLLGIINLGKKANLKRYNAADFNFLVMLKNQSAIAISNSLLYQNMEDQVRQRTNELVEVQKQLVQAEKLATVGTLAGGVAHEINNPLTAILTNVQMLLASDTVDDKLDRESLELIEEATKRCRTIVQKLMTYARKPLETTQVSSINLLDVLKSVLSFVGYQLEQDNIKIIIDAKNEAYLVMGNHNELEQVLTNLILNARDAIRSVKKSGAINIAFSKSWEWIKVEIRDEGAGIPKEIAPKIFDPFFTTKDVGTGVGLGLSICQALVEKHKGMLTFRSEPKRGSVFTIQFPRTEKSDKGEVKEAIKHEHPQKPLIDKLAKKNILIIDDDGIITKTLCDLLKGAGYYADASQNGFDAVDKTKEAVFDLIIADIKMPGMNGIMTINKIKEMAKKNGVSDIPAIFITGYADSPAVAEAKKLGEVIFKPFDTAEFLAKVAKYI